MSLAAKCWNKHVGRLVKGEAAKARSFITELENAAGTEDEKRAAIVDGAQTYIAALNAEIDSLAGSLGVTPQPPKVSKPESAPGKSAPQPTEEPSHGQGQETPEVLNQAVVGEQPATALHDAIKDLIFRKGHAVDRHAVDEIVLRAKRAMNGETASFGGDLAYMRRKLREMESNDRHKNDPPTAGVLRNLIQLMANRKPEQNASRRRPEKEAPKTVLEAEIALQDANVSREIAEFLSDERKGQQKQERVSAWRAKFSGNRVEAIAAGDISRSDYEKLGDLVDRNGITAARAAEMIDDAVSSGVIDAKVAEYMKKKALAITPVAEPSPPASESVPQEAAPKSAEQQDDSGIDPEILPGFREIVRFAAIAGSKNKDGEPLSLADIKKAYDSFVETGEITKAGAIKKTIENQREKAEEAVYGKAATFYMDTLRPSGYPSLSAIKSAVKNGAIDISGQPWATDFYSLFNIDPTKIRKQNRAGLDEAVAEQLAKFQAGEFAHAPTATGTGVDGRKIAQEQNAANSRTYAKAARLFLEGDLTAKIPGGKASNLDVEFLENVRVKPIEKTIKRVKNYADQMRALLTVAAYDDIRYYLNGIHIEPKDKRMVATDGHRMVVLNDADLSGVPQMQEGRTILNRYYGKDKAVVGANTTDVWFDGRFPDWQRVVPSKHWNHQGVFDAKRIGDQSRGLVKAWRYASGSISPVVVEIDGERSGFNAEYLADAADLFRAFGYDTFKASIKDATSSMLLESPDGRIKQIIMPARMDLERPTFLPITDDAHVAQQAAIETKDAPEVREPDEIEIRGIDLENRGVQKHRVEQAVREARAGDDSLLKEMERIQQVARGVEESKEEPKGYRDISDADLDEYKREINVAARPALVNPSRPAGGIKESIRMLSDGATAEPTFGPAQGNRLAVQEYAKAKIAEIDALRRPAQEAAHEQSTPSEALDLKGFTRMDGDNGSFVLRDGNLSVTVFPTSNGKYQAAHLSARSSPHITEQGAVDWAANIRYDGAAQTPKIPDKDKNVPDLTPSKEAQEWLDAPGRGGVEANTPPAERFEAGRALTKEQRKAVLDSLVDVYRKNKAPKEFKGVDQNGNERYGYAYSPEFFVKSDITGAMVRYYVTLPDGRIAHPTELFPDYTQSDIDAEMQRRKTEEKNRKAADEFRLKTLESRKAGSINEANRLFWNQNRGGFDAQNPEYIPALLTNGTEFIRTDPAYVGRDLELLGDGWQEKAVGEAGGGKPKIQEHKIGDALTIMGRSVILAKQKTIAGVRYELFNDAKLKDTGGATRVIDVDSGNVVSLRTYDDYSKAEAAYEEATPGGGKDAVQPAPAWHTTLPVEGLPPFKDQSRNYAAVPLKIAGEAYDAIRRDQLVAGMKMYAYVMPAADGLNGIVRLLPEDQTPPKPWKLLDGEGLRVSGMTRDQVVARIGEWLRREPILADEKATPKKGAEEQKPATDFSPLAKDVGGRIAWTDGTIALIEGYSVLNGEPVYIGAKGGQRTRVDIQSFTGNTFTAEEKAALLKARAEAVAQAAEELRKNPDGPFSAGPVVISDDIPEKVAGVAREWIRLLGLDDARIVITTPAAGAEMAKSLFGRFRRIGKANLSGQDTNGIMQPLGDNDYHIALRPGLSVLHTLEALAHELGHIVEKRAFAATKQAFRDEIRAEHEKWLKANGGGRAVDLALAMRAYRSGTRMANTEVGADQVSPYWKSFGEWFADQVSRWATTTAKPMTAVERYFKRLADRLATFFRGERAKFLPNAKVAEWLDSLSPQIGGEEDAAPPAASVRQIQDFGEKIGGARKDVWTSFKDQLSDVSDDDIANQPLSKIWPQPDYQALLDGGADPWAVAFAHAARDEIPAKPRSPWKVKNWAGKVTLLRDLTLKLMDGRYSVERAKQAIPNFMTKGMQDLAGRVELYLLVGHSKSLEGVRIRSGEYSIYNGVEYNPPKTMWTVEKDTAATAFSNWPRELAVGATKDEALQAFKEKYGSLDINPPASRETTFEIYSKRGERGYWIGKKIGRNPLLLEGPFDNIKEARKYKADHQAELVAKLEKAKEIPRERRDTNEPRVGEDMRNGQDVTPQMFSETFGFRGVEFGNWVEQGRRQKDLNDAFDALMDMAAIIGVPPKALSLNGELGLAFGARGTGGVHAASAHYESGKVVINLTKRSGAGSLGHEWWHAVDNYFARMRESGDGMMTGALDVSLVSRGSPYHHQGAVRKEMIEAFGAVMKAIRETAMKARSNKLDAKRSKDYWTTDPEMSARAFESYLISKLQDQGASNDYLANIVSPETWKAAESLGFELDDSYPYPTAGEIPAIRAGFDHFFQTVQTRETDKGVAMLSRSELNGYNEANGILDDTAGHRTINGTELAALRREAAGLERPETGKFLYVTEDGRAIATGEPRTRIPESFARFAEKHDLKFEARRRIGGDTRHIYAGNSERLPIEYRESGAMYFGEIGQFVDRTGKSRFSRSDSAADFALERLGDALINHEAQIVIGEEIPSVSVPNVRAAQLFSASGELEGNAAVVFRDGRIPMLVDIRMVHERAGLGEKYVRAMAASMGESGLMLYDIQKQAEGFWTKMGTTPENLGGELAHGNGFLFWSDYSQARVSQVHAARPAQDSASRSEHAEGGEDFLGRREAPLERGHDGRIHAEDLSAVAAEFRQVFPGLPIQTADSEAQLPKQLRQAIKDLGAQGDTAAAFHDGAVWLVRSGIHSLQHARRIVPHEATHAGLDWLLGQAKDRLLLDINRQNAAVAEKAKDIAARYRYSMVRATEEVLADMGPKVRALKGWNKLVAWVRRQFRKLGWVREWTDRDVEDLVLQALSQAKKGPRAPFGVSRASAYARTPQFGAVDTESPEFKRWFGDSKVVDAEGKPLMVYHWTDNDFTVFDMSMSGEGAHFGTKKSATDRARGMADIGYEIEEENGQYFVVADSGQKADEWQGPFATKKEAISFRAQQPKKIDPMALYLSIKNPIRLPDLGTWSAWDIVRTLPDGTLSSTEKAAIMGADDRYTKLRETLLGKGIDGIVYRNEVEDKGKDSYIAFSPTQIKSAISNTGEFSAADPDIRFSRTSQAIDLAADVLDTITQPSAKSFGMLKGLQTQLHKARTVPAYGRAFRLAMAFRNDLSRAAFRPWESAKDILPAYDDLKGAWQAILHGKKSSADITAAGRFLFDGTMYGGGNPLAGVVYSDAKLKSLGATDEQIRLYRQAREAIDASLDEVTAAVAWKLAKRYLHPAAKYVAINDPAQARDTFLDMLETARQAAEDEVGYPDQKTAQAAEKEIRKTIEAVTDTFDHAEALKAAGYAPLMRFGRYTMDVVEVDPLTGKEDRLEFRKFETEMEAKFADKEARKAHAGNQNVIVTRGVQSENSLFQGVDPETVALFAKQIAKIPGLDINKAVLDEYYRSAVSERSALVRTIKRKGVAGYSEDLPRVLASFLTSNARYASSTWHMGDLREAIQNLRDQKVHGDIADEAQALYDYINGTQEPGAWMRGLMFAWYLGGSPAAAAINLSQPVLMTFPYLAQFGPARAANALAYATVPAVRDAAVPAGMRAALRRAQEEGVVEAQEIHHLYQEGMRPILSKLPGGDSLRARAQGAAAIWGALFGMAENFNRRLTFIAAYKMASADPDLRKRFGSAYEFARRAVEETQGIYAKENRPDWARGTGPLGAVGVAAFTFKQYSIQYVELVARMWKSGPEGKRAAGLMLALLMLASGLKGLPFADDLKDLVDTILQRLGYRGNAEKAIRDEIKTLAGERMADLVLYGLSAETPVDVQGRLGLGNMLPATGLFKPSEINKASQVAELFGPPGGMARQIGDFADAIEAGKDADAFKAFSPKMVQDVTKAWQMWETGEYRDSRNRKVTEVSKGDAAIKAVGFQPQAVAEKSRKDRLVQQDVTRARDVESNILELWIEGVIDKDPKKVANARSMLREWNQKNPETRIVIDLKQIPDRVQKARMNREQRMIKSAPREIRGYVAEGTR